MPTTFRLFYLGIQAAIDTTEGNNTSENHAALNGLTVGSAGSPLYANLQELSDDPGSNWNGGSTTTAYDADNNVANETFSIDGGPVQTHDATMLYNGTVITYLDGSTATVNAIVMQDTAGNTYLLPPTSGPNAYSAALEAGPIQSVTLGTAAPSGGSNVYGMTASRYVLQTSDYVVEGTSGADNIVAGYAGDPEGDEIDGNDHVDGSNDDSIVAGAGDDTVESGAGDDTISGDAGNDQISAGTGDDYIDGGTGDDTLAGAGGDDTFAVFDDFGNDVITGGETGETAGDTLDLSGVTDDLRIDLTNANSETGRFSDGTGTTSFTEIENIILGSGRDTLFLADGGGTDTVLGFNTADSGDGTTVDQLDVSSLTSDGGTTPVTTNDVTVTDDGSGNAVLSFPGGESITLIGVPTTTVDTTAELVAIGIPIGPDYIVEGSAGADTIDGTYVADPEGDRIDNLDHSDGSNADSVQAGGGADVINAGAGDDTIDAGDGEDTIIDSAGDDIVLGGEGRDTFEYTTLTGDDTIVGGEINDTSPTFSGDKIDAHDGVEGLSVVFDGDESGTVTGGSGTIEFSEIEHFLGGQGSDTIDASASSVQQILDGGEGADTIEGGSGDDIIAMGMTQDFSATDGDRDTLVLIDGFGNDSIEGFETADSGDGTAIDQLDVSGLTSDGGTTPVTTDDVVVTDTNGDGTGDAILTFPGGESITLWGVAPTDVDSAAELEAIGIPAPAAPLNYIVEGDGTANLIDASYLGDPEGDRIDNGDALDGSDNDSVTGGAGDDTILSGAGNDSVDGGADNDRIEGGAGNDTLYGATGNDTIIGGDGADSLFGNEDNDSIEGGIGDDTIEGGTGDDTLIGGAGNDSINGDFGNDSIVGSAGNDFLRGSFGDDTIEGGTGDDTLWGGFGDDSIVVDANFGDYTIEGEEEAETLGDTMDVSAVTNDLTWDLSNPNPEAGSFTDGTNTGTYVDIENIILGSGTDTLVLDTFGGSNTVNGFSAPTDTGGGTFSGNDQLDVSGLLDFDGNATHTGNVTVTEVLGNAVLTFPNGESLTLVGVPAADVNTPAQLIAMGIPEGPDGYVDGTAGDDTIDVNYTGDPNFDRVDNNDAQLPGAGPNDDFIRAGAGNDSVVSNAGDDSVEGGTGNDTLEGGGGNDTLSGDAGADSLVGGLGDDSLVGGTGDDTLNGQIGDDVMEGGDGSDTFALEDDFGNDTIVGGEVDDVAGDTLDMSGVGGAISYDLTGLDAEAGTLSDGTSTITFSEIENITLSSGTDTIILADGSGDDTVSNFTQPFDDGFGTWVGIDQVDVSGMTDANGAMVNTGDVTVTDDGSGNAVLNFPGGESLTLIGVAPTAFPVPEALAAIGIPLADYIVEGTAAGEVIDSSYLGDPEGDMIDAGDGDPSLTDADSDSIEAGGGADTIFAGDGDDTIRGEDGDDLINGQDGNDSIDGGLGNDSIAAGLGNDSVNAGDGNDSINAGGGDDTIEGGAGNDLISGAGGADQIFGNDGDDTIVAFDGFGDDTVVGSEVGETNGDSLDLGGVSLEGVSVVYTTDESGIVTGGTSGDTIDFSEIENLVTTDNTDTVDAALDSVGVNINTGDGDDLVTGGTGADTLEGGAGSDTISGGEGGDSISGGTGDDSINVAQGDTVTGGDGDDYFNLVDLGEAATDTITIIGGEGGETGGDTLALNGLHGGNTINIIDPDDVNGGLSGNVTLLDGTVVNFTNIENIICFVPGTEIATPLGARKIEDLKIGDNVVTQDNGIQKIRWIGTTTVSGSEQFAPVRFDKSTFYGASGDLIVSPQHRMLFKGYEAELLFGEHEVLVPAIHLVDNIKVTREKPETVTYIHIMFEQHEIVFAQGIATESFHPGSFGVGALAPQAREEMFALFPEMRSDLASYGDSARTCLRAKEAFALAHFH